MRSRSLQIIHKATAPQGEPESERGIRFTLSSDARDLHGDIVVQTGLTLARDPLPAMIDHGGGIFDQIGQWTEFQFGQHTTTALLKLLEPGISRAADQVRALYAAGVRLAASIGFTPVHDRYELIRDPKNERVIGIKWLEGILSEASVVVTPANPDALALSKSLHPRGSGAGHTPNDTARTLILNRLQGTPVQASAGSPQSRKPMNIAERIRAAETSLNTLRDQVLRVSESLEQAQEGEAREAIVSELDDLNVRVDAQQRTVEVLKRSEAQLAARAVEVDAPAIVRGEPRVPQAKKASLIVRVGLLTLEAHLRRVPFEKVLDERYGRDPLGEATKAVALYMQVKAAQNPAMTTVPEWAGALVRDGYGAFLEELAVESVVPQIPLQREDFDGFNSITVAARATSPTQDPNLAGAFRAEGDPIRVGSVGLSSKKLTPKSLGIIGTFTMELFRRSTPNIEDKIREWMLEDTAVKLDGIFLGTGAGTPKQPAGIANGLGASDTAASTGASVAQITADIKARIARMVSLGLGKRPVWIMNPARAIGLALVRDATGALAFPSMDAANPTLAKIPVITSVTVPADVVYLVDAAWIAFAGGAPEFLGTEVATLHEEYDQAAVKPIIDGAGVAAAPSRSLYQTFSGALRAIWEVDWLVLRTGAVQTITGVAW